MIGVGEALIASEMSRGMVHCSCDGLLACRVCRVCRVVFEWVVPLLVVCGHDRAVDSGQSSVDRHRSADSTIPQSLAALGVCGHPL